MRKAVLLSLCLIFTVIISGCVEGEPTAHVDVNPTCDSPNKLVREESNLKCCIDNNDNNICDSDEEPVSEFSANDCPVGLEEHLSVVFKDYSFTEAKLKSGDWQEYNGWDIIPIQLSLAQNPDKNIMFSYGDLGDSITILLYCRMGENAGENINYQYCYAPFTSMHVIGLHKQRVDSAGNILSDEYLIVNPDYMVFDSDMDIIEMNCYKGYKE